MPTVPKVDRQVALEALPGVRLTAAQTPESEGAGIAEAQGQIGGALAGVGAKTAALGEELLAKERDNANAVIAIKSNSDLTGWVDKRLNDPETGALQTRGNNALGLPEKVTNEYNDYADGIAATLSNPQQRLAFARIRAERGLTLYDRLAQHTSSQINQVKADTAESSVKNSQSFAIANADNPRVLKQELATQATTITTIGKQLGMSPESIKARLDASFSATHVGVIENLLAQEKTKAAQVYFEETKSQINGEQIARIEKALHEGTTRKAGQTQADAIIAAGGTLTEQREKARQIDDADVRDQVMQRIEHEHDIAKQVDREHTEAAMKAAVNILDKTPDVAKIPPTTWVSFSEGERSSLRSYADKLSRGEAVETNIATYDVLDRLATSHDPAERQKFAEMNLVQYSGLLSKADLTKAIDWQNAIRRGEFEKLATLTASESTIRQIVDGNLTSLGVNPNPPAPGKNDYDKQASDRVLAYRRAVRDAVVAREGYTKKKLTEPEVQDIADTLMAQTVAEKWHLLSANESARYAFETPDVGVTRSADVPASERTQIEAALKKAGLPITETAIVNLFNQHLQAVRGKVPR